MGSVGESLNVGARSVVYQSQTGRRFLANSHKSGARFSPQERERERERDASGCTEQHLFGQRAPFGDSLHFTKSYLSTVGLKKVPFT